MFLRIAAIGGIFLVTSIGWMTLGAGILARTYQRGPELRDKVVSNWGGPHEQRSPAAAYVERWTEERETVVDGKRQHEQVQRTKPHELPLEATRATAGLHLDYRQKGLLWYSTFSVAFTARYSFRNPSTAGQQVTFRLQLPAAQAIYDDIVVLLDGKPASVSTQSNALQVTAPVAAGAAAIFSVSYRSQGLGSWSYVFGKDVAQVRDFDLKVRTDFDGLDFPEGALSPTARHPFDSGQELVWSYRNLMTGQHVRIAMPEKLQPGPVAGEISFFAPVSLLFFFFVMFIVTTLRRIELHPINYFFLAAAFFAFHLLFAYLVDHIAVLQAFAIASVVSVFLVVSYRRLVVGMRFAAVDAAAAQFVYLVLFSYAFFFKGFTGLSVTIGAILTLFVAMQLTGRIRWGTGAGSWTRAGIPASVPSE